MAQDSLLDGSAPSNTLTRAPIAPGVSPALAESFYEWRECHRAWHEDANGDEEEEDRLYRASAAALRKVISTPSRAASDFIVKTYLHALFTHGSTYRGKDEPGTGGCYFEIDAAQIEAADDTLDAEFERAVLRDLANCDLGRCLMAFGRLNLDTWIPKETDASKEMSIIRALHARYEAASTELNAVDEAATKLTRSGRSGAAYDKAQRGIRASMREMDALRLALLYQVPNSPVEALMLSHHISIAYDMLYAGTDFTNLEKKALGAAVDALFAYIVGNMEGDYEALGEGLRYNANRTSEAVRLRTGVIAGIE